MQSVQKRAWMIMEFGRIAGPIEGMEVWNASSKAASFVITYGNPSGVGLHGNSGYAVSWRPIDQSRSAESIGGEPFKTLAEANGPRLRDSKSLSFRHSINTEAHREANPWFACVRPPAL
jgi:hypothetical protein